MKKILFINAFIAVMPLAARAELSFDTSALESSTGDINQFDIEALSALQRQLPGHYYVDIYANDVKIRGEEMVFFECGKELCPVISKTTLDEWGVDLGQVSTLQSQPDNVAIRQPLGELIPGAGARLVNGTSRLNVTIPQRYLQTPYDNTLPPSQWQYGMPVMFTSYHYNGQKIRSGKQESTSQNYLSLQNGINVGAWRLRHSGYFTENQGKGTQWRAQQSFVGRDIPDWHSRLMLGQTSTAGRVFDSFSFKGAILTSEDSMIPDSQRNYAPVISGVALSQATVEIRQSGNIIYQKNIPPGPFSLRDVVPANTSGELQVTIRESNGRERTFIQPYATQPKMVREGQLRYSLAAGRYDNSGSDNRDDTFTQAESLYGLTNSTTLFTGAMGNPSYQSIAAGFGQNLGNIGGLSLELDWARHANNDNRQKKSGYAWQLQYGKYVESTKTTVNFALDERLDRKYQSFVDTQIQNASRYNLSFGINDLRRRTQLSISQDLGEWGSLAFNHYRQTSWSGTYGSKTLSTSYSFYFSGISTSINYSQSDITGKQSYRDNILAVNVTLPFSSLWNAANTSQVNYGYSQTQRGGVQHQLSLSGSLLRDDNLHYSLTQSRSRSNHATWQSNESAYVQYEGSYGSMNASWSQSSGNRHQYGIGADGAVVIHPNGITLGHSIDSKEAFAIVRAPGAKGVAVSSKPGIKTDWRGYAIVPSLTPYRKNSVGLNSTTAADNAELKSTSIDAVPGFAAAIDAAYSTAIGNKAYLRIHHHKTFLPLGTELIGKDEASGIVDEQGYAYITGLNDGDTLIADVNAQRCQTTIHFRQLTFRNGMYTGAVQCK